jgi:hypothetical protein
MHDAKMDTFVIDVPRENSLDRGHEYQNALDCCVEAKS